MKMSKKKLKKRLKKLEQWRAKHELRYNDTVTLVTSYKVEVSRLHEKLNKLEQKILDSKSIPIVTESVEGWANEYIDNDEDIFTILGKHKTVIEKLEEINVNLDKRLEYLEMYKRLEDNPTRRH